MKFLFFALILAFCFCKKKRRPCKLGQYLNKNRKCRECNPGFYCNGKGIRACPDEKTSERGAKHRSDCHFCDPGFYYNKKKDHCVECFRNHFCLNDKIHACKDGEFADYGQFECQEGSDDAKAVGETGGEGSDKFSKLKNKSGKYVDDEGNVCKRILKSKCNPARCFVSAKATCKGDKVAKNENMYFIIAKKYLPIFTSGSKTKEVDVDKVTDEKTVNKEAIRQSVGFLAFFEYAAEDESDGFSFDDDKRIVAKYSLLGSAKKFGWKDMREKKNKVGKDKDADDILDFVLTPDYSKMSTDDQKAFPHFTLQAVSTSGVVLEAKKGEMKQMVIDPSSLKIALNVTNAKCKNSTATGIGVMLFFDTKKGFEKKEIDEQSSTMDIPSVASDTNTVLDNNEDDKKAGYVSFSKQVGVRNLKTGEIETKKIYFEIKKDKEITSQWKIDGNTKDKIDVQNRNVTMVFMSIPGCDIDNYYWDPATGFSEIGLSDILDAVSVSSKVFVALFLMFFVFLF